MQSCYHIFHANLSFSSIEESALGNVIDKTYFPLLELLELNPKFKVGFEISGHSLERLKSLRPSWIKKFLSLYENKQIELLASGYMQIIGPLVPNEVNKKNHEIGLKIYENILGIKPNIVYVNEQTISASIIDFYNDFGYCAIAMEWNNFYSKNPSNCHIEYSFQPILLKGSYSEIPVIWTDTIVFQQFQRTVHGDQTIDKFDKFLSSYLSSEHKWVSIYSSDLEVFGYRPGRFDTETALKNDEWAVIKNIFLNLLNKFDFCLPSYSLSGLKEIKFSPFDSQNPIFVKKQDKYSLSRWSACGRNSNYLNTLCYRYLNILKNNDNEKNWKLLLKLWGSDFRTHTTIKKWREAVNSLEIKTASYKSGPIVSKRPESLLEGNFYSTDEAVTFQKGDVRASFYKSKGLCLDSLIVDGSQSWLGSVPHGSFKNISFAADFFCGSSLIQDATFGNISDLGATCDVTTGEISDEIFLISGIIKAKFGIKFKKHWIIDVSKRIITCDVSVIIPQIIRGFIRLGTITLCAQGEIDWYKTHNGGREAEKYFFDGDINHHLPKSLIQSSTSGIGATQDGYIAFGSSRSENLITVNIQNELSAPFLMLQKYSERKFEMIRVFCSTQEIDDTLNFSRHSESEIYEKRVSWKIKI